MKTLLEPRLLKRLTKKKARLDTMRPLPAAAVARLAHSLNVEWIDTSNAIEGSTLTLRETELMLEQGIAIGGKSLREHCKSSIIATSSNRCKRSREAANPSHRFRCSKFISSSSRALTIKTRDSARAWDDWRQKKSGAYGIRRAAQYGHIAIL